MRPQVAERLGLGLDEFEERWYQSDLSHLRETGPLAAVLARLDLAPEAAETILELRRPLTKEGLTPVDGAVETIAELRRRGFRIRVYDDGGRRIGRDLCSTYTGVVAEGLSSSARS